MSAAVLTSASTVSEITLMAWVDVAEPGARLLYHHGFLIVDTTPNVSLLGKDALEGLRATADAAYRLSELGRVHLYQERLGPDHFAYFAIARPHKGTVPSASVKQLAAAA
ncbi:hypothetical protein [Tateyamaria pelophila]|uniref:hypothetical protein n=1 Tax=Tateyamaria pelophila TaxID=328415 RepID=UPI001CBBF602|nr:hypothetical protein [Tateyamaria pelophila]